MWTCKIGDVRNFHIDDPVVDDSSPVVDVDAWLKNQSVAIAIRKWSSPMEKAIINVRLTKREVRDSPGVITENRANQPASTLAEGRRRKDGLWMRNRIGWKYPTPAATKDEAYAKKTHTCMASSTYPISKYGPQTARLGALKASSRTSTRGTSVTWM